jgi:FixJ family two-component response regulator
VLPDRNKVVVVIDDDEAIREAAASLVRSLGWPVRAYASGVEFLDADTLDDIGCLVSDVRMQGMTGIEMHDRLLARGYVIPTLFVTAFSTPDLHAKLRAKGVLAVLDKPLDAASIADWLNRALGPH